MTGNDCSTCKHFDLKVQDRNVCAAFPDGIPVGIQLGEIGHQMPVEGDHGIVWEPAPGFEYKKRYTGKNPSRKR